jgi:hypothetical protein
VIVVLRQLFAAALVVRRWYLIMVSRPLPAAPLAVRRRYLIVVPRPTPAAPRMYLIVVYRPLPAAPLVVRCIYMVVVPGPTHLRGVVDAGFNSWLAHAARSAETDACGRSFAVLSTQVSTDSLRTWRNRLTCGSMVEVSRDASLV